MDHRPAGVRQSPVTRGGGEDQGSRLFFSRPHADGWLSEMVPRLATSCGLEKRPRGRCRASLDEKQCRTRTGVGLAAVQLRAVAYRKTTHVDRPSQPRPRPRLVGRSSCGTQHHAQERPQALAVKRDRSRCPRWPSPGGPSRRRAERRGRINRDAVLRGVLSGAIQTHDEGAFRRVCAELVFRQLIESPVQSLGINLGRGLVK